MKRSEVNTILKEAKGFFKKSDFHLPEWVYWSPEDWKGEGERCSEIINNNLGWDITEEKMVLKK